MKSTASDAATIAILAIAATVKELGSIIGVRLSIDGLEAQSLSDAARMLGTDTLRECTGALANGRLEIRCKHPSDDARALRDYHADDIRLSSGFMGAVRAVCSTDGKIEFRSKGYSLVAGVAAFEAWATSFTTTDPLSMALFDPEPETPADICCIVGFGRTEDWKPSLA
ncbi:MAG: hypothetical protein ACT4OZ_15020 [Gemmatimonadota bacterium]